MINPQIDFINDDSLYVISCNQCAKKNTSACNTCSRKRTEPKPNKECHQCSEKPKKCGCEDKKDNCTVKRSVCNSEHFAVKNYFSELVHDWEKDLAKYNLGISELESINYFTDQTESGELLNKVQFVFRRGHEVITKEFLVAPKGDKGDKGDCFTWESLTDAQKRALKGDKGDDGDTPVLRFVKISYSDSPCEVSGTFERFGDTNMYDLLLTLPKQRTFDECLEEIRRLINQFNINFEAQLAALTQRVNSLEDFDFCKLGLKLRNGNELSLTYNGLTSNSVLLNLPEQDEYTLKYLPDMESMWKDQLVLLKNGVKEGDIFSPEKFKPKDWWILPYPGVILIQNGELLTKRVRVSAWQKAIDETEAQENIEDRNFSIFLQTTASYQFNPETSQYDDVTWSNLNYTYNKSTGMLTLPENNTFSTVTDTVDGQQVTRNVQYRYHSGDFIMAALWATDHLPRRILIPIIDVNNYYTNTDTNTLLVDINPKNISDDIQYAVINYTKTWQFDLRGSNFYDSNGDLINCIIEVHPSTIIYKNYNGKKYFCGNYTIVTCDEDAQSPEGTLININRFKLYQITHPNLLNKIRLQFKYLDDNNVLKDLTQAQHAAFYNYWKNHIGSYFNKAVRLKHKTSNQYVDLTLDEYSSSFIPGIIQYSYNEADVISYVSTSNSSATYYLPSTGRRPSQPNDTTLLNSFRLFVKDNLNTTEYQVFLNISVLNSGAIILSQPVENQQLYGSYVSVFNTNIMDAIQDTISVNSEIQQSINIPSGTVYSNGMFFYNGLFVAESQLNGDVTVSDTGEYAYTHVDDSIQVQNLTNKEIVISVDDKTFTIAPNATVIEELEPGEPVNH